VCARAFRSQHVEETSRSLQAERESAVVARDAAEAHFLQERAALSALERRLRTSLAAADAKTQAAEISREVRRSAHARDSHAQVLWWRSARLHRELGLAGARMGEWLGPIAAERAQVVLTEGHELIENMKEDNQKLIGILRLKDNEKKALVSQMLEQAPAPLLVSMALTTYAHQYLAVYGDYGCPYCSSAPYRECPDARAMPILPPAHAWCAHASHVAPYAAGRILSP
jgi:hypothetical protein